MKKRLISMCLSICFALSIIQPALASEPHIQKSTFEEYEIVLASGDRIAFVPTGCTDNSYEYSYYLNGEYVAKYEISSLDWSLTRIDAKTGDATLIETNLDIPSETSDEYAAKAYVASVPAGSIIFNYSSQLGGSPRSDVRYESNSSTSQQKVVGEAGQEVAQAVGLVTTILLGMGFYYFPASCLAEAILQAAFGGAVGLIENGIFTMACTETFTTYITTYNVTVATYGNNVTSHTHIYSGAERWVSCRSYFTSTDDYDVQGVTARNWNSGSNIQMFWSDAYGRVSNPGYRVVYG